MIKAAFVRYFNNCAYARRRSAHVELLQAVVQVPKNPLRGFFHALKQSAYLKIPRRQKRSAAHTLRYDGLFSLLEVRSERLEVRNSFAKFARACHFCGFDLEARGKIRVLKALH